VTSLPARPLWRGRALAFIGIVLLAFSLRSAVASLSPLYDHITREFALPSTVIGLIGTVPPLCYAVFGLIAPGFERRFGLERTTITALAIITLGLVARASAPNAGVLLAASALVFAGIGVGNVLLPALVKKYLPDRIGLMTTIYSTMMAISTFVPPLIAVPFADATDWHLSVGVWAVFALSAMVPWVVQAIRERANPVDVDLEEASPRVLGRMWRLSTPWALIISFVATSSTAYISFAWLPTILVEVAGVTPHEAGLLLSLFALMGLPTSLLVPVLVVRFRMIMPLWTLAAILGMAGALGLLFAPTFAPWLWVACLGLVPLLFPAVLALVGARTRTHDATVALSSFVQSVGYGITTFTPVGVGLIHDAAGDWTVALVFIGVISALAFPAGFVIARPGTVEDEWERRYGRW
jgi:MFS transporter, CP family, cyanate transporter